MVAGVKYEDYYPEAEVAIYKKIKAGSQNLGTIEKQVLAHILEGHIAPGGKHLLRTELGVYRIANRHNSDNTTERRAHDELGVKTVVTSDDGQLAWLLREHGFSEEDIPVAIGEFKSRVREAMDALGDQGTLL